MAERMTQAQALLAVLAGGMRKERTYFKDLALRSSLYGILDDKDGVTAEQIELDAIYFIPLGEEQVSASQIGLDDITLRTTQISYESPSEQINAAKISLDDIYLRTTLIKYTSSDEENIMASQIGLDSIYLYIVLVKYDEKEVHQINASKIQLDNITLTIG
ncbi:MAG: hypothetical protein ACN2B6_01130 [Rickettsiales bacterium]